MKILDRYILSSIAGTFFFGVAMFLALIMAMSVFQKFVEMIAEQGIPVLIALKIFALRIPGDLVYAFPMSVLLSILLVFNRMSSESEMVAIRAAGVSFIRIVVPALIFALCITGVTFWISNVFAPYAGERAARLTQETLRTMQAENAIGYTREEDGHAVYSVSAENFDIDRQEMKKLTMLFFDDGVPMVLVHAPKASWNVRLGRWQFHDATVRVVKPQAPGFWMIPTSQESRLSVAALALRLEESPFEISMKKRKPQEVTAAKIRQYITRMETMGNDPKEINKWKNGLAQRYAVPFASLIFALIGAPLGLRHHRTSSAMGLGISLLLIFVYYSIFNYLSMLGEGGQLNPIIAAWVPNSIGAVVGTVLLVRANT